jgi:hypothetical protein
MFDSLAVAAYSVMVGQAPDRSGSDEFDSWQDADVGCECQAQTLVSRDYIITELEDLPLLRTNLRSLIIPFAIWKNNDSIINPRFGLAKHSRPAVSTDSGKMALVANVLEPWCAELVFFSVEMSPPSFFFLLFSQFYDDNSIQ